MWVQFQVSFSAIYGFKRQAIIRWPTYGIGKYSVIFNVHKSQIRPRPYLKLEVHECGDRHR